MDTHAETHEHYPDAHHDVYSKTIFGFWLYLLTDFVLFGSFFATYAVLHKGTFGGPSAHELFDLPYVMIETLIFLTCSFTSGIAGVYAHRKDKGRTIAFFAITFLLGLVFLSMEVSAFSHLISAGNDWQRSAFLSAFFTLVGTLAFHVVFALAWTIVLLIPVMREGVNSVSIRRLTCLRMFWQFLNVMWVFVFTIIYCMGARE
ncbi:MAG TPA: cytochrome o ubiquinol oxidase subunit III [Rhabdochlamydiaceae bacterium]|jgi:cytochrome o ubiquinol oxidase subunit 3